MDEQTIREEIIRSIIDGRPAPSVEEMIADHEARVAQEAAQLEAARIWTAEYEAREAEREAEREARVAARVARAAIGMQALVSVLGTPGVSLMNNDEFNALMEQQATSFAIENAKNAKRC